jgi:FAD:protein FMN transferase
MGTVFSFAWRRPPPDAAMRAVERELIRIEEVFSTYLTGSEISALAAGEVTVSQCSPEVRRVVGLCTRAERLTGGYFSASWGGGIDPTGLVKGWAVRRAADLLSAAGSTSHVVNGGGDVLAVADPRSDLPWKVGVSGEVGCVVAVVPAHHLAVATSGNVERPGEIIDPHTGRPAVALRSVTVIGPDIVMADAFATAAVAMGHRALAWLEELPGHEAVVVFPNGVVSATRGALGFLVDRPGNRLTRAGRGRTAAM